MLSTTILLTMTLLSGPQAPADYDVPRAEPVFPFPLYRDRPCVQNLLAFGGSRIGVAFRLEDCQTFAVSVASQGGPLQFTYLRQFKETEFSICSARLGNDPGLGMEYYLGPFSPLGHYAGHFSLRTGSIVQPGIELCWYYEWLQLTIGIRPVGGFCYGWKVEF